MLRDFFLGCGRLTTSRLQQYRDAVRPAGEVGMATVAAGLVAVLATAAAATTLTVASTDVDFSGVEDLIDTSFNRVSGTLEVRSSVIARADEAGTVSEVQVLIRYYGEGPALAFAPEDLERLLVSYYDGDTYVPDLPYAVEIISGNGDALLDPWESALLTLDLNEPDGPIALQGGDRFTLELSAPFGAQLRVERRLPPILQPVMSLN